MSEEGPTTGQEPEFVQSLARGLSVVAAFDAEHGAMTLSEVAARTSLSRATARRLLHTLAGLGYVRADGRTFRLTPQVLRLGTAYLSGMGLPQVAQPHLEELSARTGESSSVAVLDGTEIVYVARVSTTHRLMRAGITVGTRFPAHATSMGRVLLAALPAGERADWVADWARAPASRALTELTVDTPERLDAVLDEVHRDGWALVDQELEPGLRSLAAPLRDAAGRVVAAVNLSMSAVGPAASALDLLPALTQTATAISDDLALVP